LAAVKGQPQNESTELESLLYSMLYAATKGRLHWGAYLHTDPRARDAKLAAMGVTSRSEAVVLSRIDEGVQVKDFIAAIHQCHAEVSEI